MGKAKQQKRIRKLTIHAINEAIKVGVMPLTSRYRRMTAKGYAKITVCDKPTIINWADTGHDDFRVTIWWDYHPEQIPQLIKGSPENLKLLLPDVDRDRFRFVVGMCASFYFDYLYKGILSDRGRKFFAVYVRKSSASYIDELEDVQPFCYSMSELTRPLHRLASPTGCKRKEIKHDKAK